MREREVETYLKKKVKALGGEVRKVAWAGVRGAPDRLCMFPKKNLSFWAELKATGVKPEPYQLREHVRMRESGMVVIILDSPATIDAFFNVWGIW